MAQMRIAFLRAYLGAHHAETLVRSLNDMLGRDRFGETGPARAAIEFVDRREKGLARDDIHVKAGAMIVPVGISKRRFGSVFTRDVVLLLCQLSPEDCVGRHG